MKLAPDATLDPATQQAVAAAFGLGEPMDARFVARGAMGAVNRLDTNLGRRLRYWTVKRSYWNHFTEQDIAREVDFTEECESVGVLAPRSIQRVDGGGYVLKIDEGTTDEIQYRVLEWVDGEVGRSDDPRTIAPIAEWMARIHSLAVDPGGRSIDEWFVRVHYDWDELTGRLARRAPDVAELIRSRRLDIQELTDFVNGRPESGAVLCHTDMGASNLVWGASGPHLIDWENSGPLVPRQELGSLARSMGSFGKSAYQAYRQAGGPEEITDVTHIASSIAVHLNYLGVQAELLLDDEHVEQHEFALDEVSGQARSLTNLHKLDQWVNDLQSSHP
ncbi:MAG: phosphotransferase [Thermomicrobiales bacterium]